MGGIIVKVEYSTHEQPLDFRARHAWRPWMACVLSHLSLKQDKQWKLTPVLRVEELNARIICSRLGYAEAIMCDLLQLFNLTRFRS